MHVTSLAIFVFPLGYKRQSNKDYFASYCRYLSDFRVDFRSVGSADLQDSNLDWNVTEVDTGFHTMTGGRLPKLSTYLSENFFWPTVIGFRMF